MRTTAALVLAAVATLVAALVPVAASARASDGTSGVPTFVTIPPQAHFVERVGGEFVEVGVLVQPGQSPHAYEPTPRQMASLAEADVYFTVGLPFEESLVRRIRSLAPELEVVATDYPVPKRSMEDTEADDEHAGHHDDDRHGGRLDPHVWLDPDLVKIQARVIAETLERLDPDHAAAYESNLEKFVAELDSLDAEISEALEPLAGSRLYVFHPSFGYFADAYGLTQVAVETGGKEPGARQLAQLIKRARADSVRVIFVQPQFSSRAAQALAEAIDGAVVPIDPLARDYTRNLLDIANKVRRGLEGNRG